ncbi:hypothetical protein QR680_007768 [Steinernema hermaphroditum]|uniref:Uncharacterized protein n=1 Tax=Steinernema hermaphroditum TaxID=289476 RepID=A0AA39M5V7_9BILA|nr:hypothetical protein QR680_007768 [Steinernema hermaphroditum]
MNRGKNLKPKSAGGGAVGGDRGCPLPADEEAAVADEQPEAAEGGAVDKDRGCPLPADGTGDARPRKRCNTRGTVGNLEMARALAFDYLIGNGTWEQVTSGVESHIALVKTNAYEVDFSDGFAIAYNEFVRSFCQKKLEDQIAAQRNEDKSFYLTASEEEED